MRVKRVCRGLCLCARPAAVEGESLQNPLGNCNGEMVGLRLRITAQMGDVKR